MPEHHVTMYNLSYNFSSPAHPSHLNLQHRLSENTVFAVNDVSCGTNEGTEI